MCYLVKDANESYRQGDYSSALIAYQMVQKKYPTLAKLFDINILLCQKYLACSQSPRPRPDIYITLTTIYDRLDKLIPVVESLHYQEMMPTKIIINLSERAYLLDKGIARDDARVQKLLAFPFVEINWTENTGPYRKIIPFMKSHYENKEIDDAIFITVDDDTLYPDYFVKTLYEKHIEFDCIVAFRGRRITLENGSIATYSKWELGEIEASLSNLPTGKDGIIYNTKYFTRDFLDIDMAKELAPTADDLWIKWHTALNGVKAIVLNPEAATSDYKSFPVVDYSSEYRNNSLFKAHNSSNAGGKNDLSVTKLEEYFLNKYGYNLASIC